MIFLFPRWDMLAPWRVSNIWRPVSWTDPPLEPTFRCVMLLRVDHRTRRLLTLRVGEETRNIMTHTMRRLYIYIPTWMVNDYPKCREIYQSHGCYGRESYEEIEKMPKHAQTVFCITKKKTNLLRLNISGGYPLHRPCILLTLDSDIGEYLHFGAWNCWLLKWPLQVAAAVEKEKHLLQQNLNEKLLPCRRVVTTSSSCISCLQ